MSLSFDRALGLHEQALNFRADRAAVLANNIANADTPNYQARDLDFASVLEAQQTGGDRPFQAARTHARHLDVEGFIDQAAGLRYRLPNQPSVDGNTVEVQAEQARYTQNAIDFQASFTFLNSKFKGLMTALRGD
ncbi:flagellar basal body rod protein FlgB [Pseudomonas saudimassiliensis]|uniref:Flagellar basal body rod protein FlgB n=1 Tax=Pseudomonas saudimassiliensis TaxID=1461581 RepID=A0A078MJ22_9PSED|nr:flagellar basal body rod protein FlgB [Pseudomonas saudimassiliensis]CEA06239.1 flagellar basal body rod protein FlgB [Pseudomonas saudimassiliensis]CEF27664.1 flagellar basal body rod protein FlgB [Pseudomonas saudimassiliensis]